MKSLCIFYVSFGTFFGSLRNEGSYTWILFRIELSRVFVPSIDKNLSFQDVSFLLNFSMIDLHVMTLLG